MRSMIYTLVFVLVLVTSQISPALAQVPDDCDISDNVLADIRLMLTAEDNGDFSFWTPMEIACGCIELYYNDPADAPFHDRVITGAVVLLATSGEPIAVPVLIDAIDTHPAQALYNLGSFHTVEALNAIVAHIRDENVEARDNAAEGLRRMTAPLASEMESGWSEALEAALTEVGEWMIEEPEDDIQEYFFNAYSNLELLLEEATVISGTQTSPS